MAAKAGCGHSFRELAAMVVMLVETQLGEREPSPLLLSAGVRR
jgi:hypothetical protein